MHGYAWIGTLPQFSFDAEGPGELIDQMRDRKESRTRLWLAGRENWKLIPSSAIPLHVFPPRYKSVPEQLRRFVSSYQSLSNEKENQWLLSAVDYNSVRVEGFNWNEFELMSIQAAGSDSTRVAEIKAFWTAHLPIFMRVDGDYFYAAYCCAGINKGHYVQGFAPDVEEVSVVGNTLSDFQEWLLRETAV